MTLRKSSLLLGKHRIHFWDDQELDFHAEAYKTHEGWHSKVGTDTRLDATYSEAVDSVMDKYRLVQGAVR